jgi:hypothetical protein
MQASVLMFPLGITNREWASSQSAGWKIVRWKWVFFQFMIFVDISGFA